MLKFSDQAMLCRYAEFDDAQLAVTACINAVESRQTDGIRVLADFEFDILHGSPCLKLGPYTLWLSQLAFRRLIDIYKISAGLAYDMGRKGPVGHNYLVSLINDALQGKTGHKKKIERTLYLFEHQTKNEFTIREMCRPEDYERGTYPIPASEIWELLNSFERFPQLRDTKLVALRISDYHTNFRIRVDEEDEGKIVGLPLPEVFPMVDIGFSLASKMFLTRPSVRCEVDGKPVYVEIPNKIISKNIDDAVNEFNPSWEIADGEAKSIEAKKEGPEFGDTTTAIAAMIHAMRKRRVLVKFMRDVAADIASAEGTDAFDIGAAIGKMQRSCPIPDVVSRSELVMYDILSNGQGMSPKIEPTEANIKEAMGYVKGGLDKFLEDSKAKSS